MALVFRDAGKCTELKSSRNDDPITPTLALLVKLVRNKTRLNPILLEPEDHGMFGRTSLRTGTMDVGVAPAGARFAHIIA